MTLDTIVNFNAVILFVLLIVPGFISMRVYSLIRPGDQTTLKDSIFEALAYGTLNFGIMYWAILLFFETESRLVQSALAAMFLVAGPIVGPFALDRLLAFAARKAWIHHHYKTAWDDFFSRRKACWIIVHLPDGQRVGGIFGSNSYATLHPMPGHLFIEELWEIDQTTGEFLGSAPVSQGLILKPMTIALWRLSPI